MEENLAKIDQMRQQFALEKQEYLDKERDRNQQILEEQYSKHQLQFKEQSLLIRHDSTVENSRLHFSLQEQESAWKLKLSEA